MGFGSGNLLQSLERLIYGIIFQLNFKNLLNQSSIERHVVYFSLFWRLRMRDYIDISKTIKLTANEINNY